MQRLLLRSAARVFRKIHKQNFKVKYTVRTKNVKVVNAEWDIKLNGKNTA
jgi:hypothetical protein